MYRPDSGFIKDKLAGARQVISLFERYQDADGSLNNVPYWVFTDWIQGKGWDLGMVPIGPDGESAVLDLQLLWAYQLGAELENNLGIKELSAQYRSRSEKLKKTMQTQYWDAARGLYLNGIQK